MGGSGQPRPTRSTPESPKSPEKPRREFEVPLGADSPAGVGVGLGQESGAAGRKEACPSDFPAEVTDIPQALQVLAAGVIVDTELPIELREGDPVFLLDGQTLGWLADNIEEVTECLQAGWRYRGIVRSNQSTPAGPVILTQVFGTGPAT